MKVILCLPLYMIFGCLFPVTVHAQSAENSSKTVTQPVPAQGLFETDEILNIRLAGDIRELVNDKGDNPQYHQLTLSYRSLDSNQVILAIQAKTRGHFRRTMGNCAYPPLQLKFSKNDTLSSSVFAAQNKLKLVMPCKSGDYVIREWLAYKVYNLVTPKSFRARLVRVELYDTKRNKTAPSFYGILLEEDQQMSARNNSILVKRVLRPEQTDPEAFLKMAVFEYLIGNTDWSVQYQNTKLIAADSNAVPVAVPYDFDHAGIVDAPYAKPAEELQMSSVRERRYRGYCIEDMSRFDNVIALFNNLKPDIYKLYTDCSLLDEKYIKSALQYFDAFYKTINDATALQREFGYPCNKNGTGNVVIKGLKEE